MGPLDLTELNKFFNAYRPKPSPKPLTAEDEKWLDLYFARIRRLNGVSPPSLSLTSSPASSTTSLSTDNEDIHSNFMTDDKISSSILANQTEFQRCPHLNDCSQAFDGSQEKTQQRQSWSEVQPQYTFTSTHDIHPPSPTPVTQKFNPHAAPFVPTYALANHDLPAYVPSPVPQIAQPLPSPQPVWFNNFWAGTHTNTTNEHKAHSFELVSSQIWTTEAIAELAQNFCWKGSEGLFPESAGVAPFARAVYIEFWNKDAAGGQCGSAFLSHLQECVVWTFDACWNLVCFATTLVALVPYLHPLFTLSFYFRTIRTP